MQAVDLMRELRPCIMVPQHTFPVYGEDTIMDILTCYRDAIQFTHDQTVRYMNQGNNYFYLILNLSIILQLYNVK